MKGKKQIGQIGRGCPKCGYSWIPRVADPKECPNCKARLRRAIPSKGKGE